MKLKEESDSVWLNAHSFLEPVKYNKRRFQDSLPRKPQFPQKLRKKSKERGK